MINANPPASPPDQPVNEVAVSFELNGDDQSMTVDTSEILVDTIRHRFGLTGTKIGCDQGACGACTVRLDADPVAACSTFTWQADGAAVTTIEGLGLGPAIGNDPGGRLSIEQAAFANGSAFQCGYCTPGLIMSTAALLDTHPNPDRETIIEWLGANICRCTGYLMIIEAVEAAASARATANHPDNATDNSTDNSGPRGDEEVEA